MIYLDTTPLPQGITAAAGSHSNNRAFKSGEPDRPWLRNA